MRELLNELVAASKAYGKESSSGNLRRLLSAREAVDDAITTPEPRETTEAVAWVLWDADGIISWTQDAAVAETWRATASQIMCVRPLVFGDILAPAGAAEIMAWMWFTVDGQKQVTPYKPSDYVNPRPLYAHPTSRGQFVRVMDQWALLSAKGTMFPAIGHTREEARHQANVLNASPNWRDHQPISVMRIALVDADAGGAE